MTLPDYSQGSGFYDPSHSYTGQLGAGINWSTQMPGLYQSYGTDENPQGVYRAALAKMGLGGVGSRARTAQGMYGQAQAGYEAAKANSNAELFFPEYLDQSHLSDIFNNLSYGAQGLDPGQFGQRPYRWSQRPA